jgi:RNA polymerase sigma-70 factor (ECF subfamily)
MSMLGTQAEAEEVVQETLIVAFRGMADWRGEGSVKAWLYGIARRQCARRVAKRVRQERRLRLVHDAPAEGDLPQDVVERRRRAQAVRAAVGRLKPTEREVVVLRYEAGLSYREIASICQIDEAAARKRASRALINLRGQIDSEVL